MTVSSTVFRRAPRRTTLCALTALTLLAACASPPESAVGKAAAEPQLGLISAPALLRHIQVLASDEFEGRAPGSTGEKKSVAYITEQFKQIGLAPGNPDGSYVQAVPMNGVLSRPALTIEAGGKSMPLAFPQDFVAFSYRNQPEVRIDRSQLVFVGYGVQAPEFGWDDYKGADLRGKTLVMLINDPPIPDPAHPGKLDPAMFGGDAMTYYGRWTYKYEMAAKMGAAAALIVHETGPAAYPYEVVRNSWTRENFDIASAAPNGDFPAVPGWLQLDQAKALFKASGMDFDTMKAAALSKNFKPVPMPALANYRVANKVEQVASNNVVAKIEGSDPQLKKEVVIYSAHWDHLGIDEKLPGGRTRQIYHGALDNASGVATLLELARAFKALPVAPKRTVLFIATTSEEQGLLGARYYARHPLYPIENTLVDINMDGINPYGRTRDIRITGAGKSDTDQLVAKYAERQGRRALPEARPDRGGFYRADQFEFAKVGVPGVYLGSGTDFIGKPATFGSEKSDAYTAHAYHKVDDTVQADWDFSGAVEDAQLLFAVGYDIAQGGRAPQWLAGAEFKRAAAH
ncbi:MAG: M20/M25/M40 family metallo-hydrolase [Pseudomonadota bacterium]|nr:M20/M25/M40 family metallo-hydrolase [Pseudomonadota bacterium]